MKKTILSIIAAGVMSLALVGCNTMHGLGQDIEAGGQGLANSAAKHGAKGSAKKSSDMTTKKASDNNNK